MVVVVEVVVVRGNKVVVAVDLTFVVAGKVVGLLEGELGNGRRVNLAGPLRAGSHCRFATCHSRKSFFF